MSLRHSTFFLAALALLGPAHLCAQFDDDEREPKKGDTKYAPGDGPAEREAKAWITFLKKLGPGPVYRIEVLARDGDTNRFFLHQSLLSPAVPRIRRMFGLGLSEAGQPVPPPDPGQARTLEALREVSKGGKEVFPLAWRTRCFRASLAGKDVPSGSLEIAHSDLATTLALSQKPGDVTHFFFGALWRIEQIEPELLFKLEPLRRDPKAFRDRVAAIRGELKSAQVLGIERERDKIEFSRYLPIASR